ncbi:hypothetical protein TH63_19170 [Rufibacter radiotolerans]|uniref:Uncharacterized protein n=1 Tax=Rufibacter radiotolerans TaxID=1379910 RepID=A0A0H4VMZ4_9BACT|nr:hypothetical protein [Rufibacter radiotolerans]AKQ47280.1 hypothetical protein TH63_19170 [Rufibacter radiotolerans]
MEQNNKFNKNEELPKDKDSAKDLKQTSQEPGAGAKGNASAQQGGQQPGNSQGGKGGKSTDHDQNTRHDIDNEMSIFGRQDS